MKRTIAIDFDGTIVDHRFPEIGELKPGAKEAINELAKEYDIVISSCRSSVMFQGQDRDHVKEMKDFLDTNGINYTRIDMGNEGKVVAFYYIDDRAIHFTSWEAVLKRIK